MKCIAIVPCEKLIIDKEGAHSIINVMLNAEIALQQIETQKAPQLVPIPTDAVSPTTWWVYTIWNPSSKDVGENFDQVYQLYWPSGDKLLENRLSFRLDKNALMQTTFSFVGLPVGQEGRIRIATWIDHKGHCISEIAETFIYIKHKIAAAANSAPAGL
jgi:hypothetical protein